MRLGTGSLEVGSVFDWPVVYQTQLLKVVRGEYTDTEQRRERERQTKRTREIYDGLIRPAYFSETSISQDFRVHPVCVCLRESSI